MSASIKPLAFYLPQYHPIPENDAWWGKGFTEWTNVTKATPLFNGHRQPRLPADLGYYDLRLAEAREQQAALAKTYGIYGFIYYHYWFGHGKQVIERPLNEVVASGTPDFPFCICWANQTWSGIWHGAPNKVLMKQEYPGEADLRNHFEYLLKAFNDPRYIRVAGKPLFMIYDASDLPDPLQMTQALQALAREAGLPGLYLMASNVQDDDWDAKAAGFDAKVSNAFNRSLHSTISHPTLQTRVRNKLRRIIGSQKATALRRLDHKTLVERMDYRQSTVPTYPIVVPNWDNTPRSGLRGLVLEGSTPALFKEQLTKAIASLKAASFPENFLFIKSWNEWAEGNYLEPDTVDGHAYLEAVREVVQ
ncbi:MAG: lipopolysaccharide biosynthesis protein [Sphingobacteriales bacterium]|nr:MAG: lipopolysaccharide biosynthesis protein [Sphingobacteriales bacterium]